MLAIWKYTIKPDGGLSISMPVGAEILSLQVQHGNPCVWVKVDVNAQKEDRQFRIIATGQTVENFDNLSFVGTFQVEGGSLVFHLFEVTEWTVEV